MFELGVGSKSRLPIGLKVYPADTSVGVYSIVYYENHDGTVQWSWDFNNAQWLGVEEIKEDSLFYGDIKKDYV